TAPSMLVRTIRPASSGSSGARSWSPRTPKASIAMSTSPSASKTASTVAPWAAQSSASKARQSTRVAPRRRRSSAASVSASGRRPASTSLRVRPSTRARAGGGDGLVDAVEQRSQPGDADGDVECQGPARAGEGERARRARAETLENREEGGGARRAQPLERVADDVLGAEGHHQLVLEETGRPVEEVPALEPVEGMEE